MAVEVHIPREATVVVAASDSLTLSADYKCSGAIDNVEIQAAIDALPAGGGKVVLLEGTYVLAAYVTVPSNVTLEGVGEATFIDATGLSYSYYGAIRMKGSLPGTSSALTVDAAKYQTDATVADASGFSVGDWIRIRDNNTWPGGQESGELQRIASIAGNVITCELLLADDYTVADTATVDLVTIVEGVHLRNFKIQGWGDEAMGFEFEYGYNHSVENVTLLDFGYCAVRFQDCVTCRATGNLIERCNEAGMGYGVAGSNCARDIIVSNNRFYDCRHAVTFCGGAGGFGVSRNCIADSNTCYFTAESTYQQFDTHGGGEHITFSNNTVIGATLAVARCSHVHIVGNYCEANYHAVELRADSSQCSVVGNHLVAPSGVDVRLINISSSNHLIEGNTIVNPGAGAGIRLIPANGHAVSDVAILSNKIHCLNNCIELTYTQAGILASENITIVGNELISDNYMGVAPNSTRVALKHLLIHGNKFTVRAAGIYFSGAAPGSIEDILISDNIMSESVHWGSMYGYVKVLDGTVVTNLDVFDNIMIDAVNGVILGNATTSVRVKGNRYISLTTDFQNDTGEYIAISNNYVDIFMDCLAASDNYVRDDEDLSAGIPITFTIDAQPDVPRLISYELTHANITAYTLEITGVTAKGNTITETFTEADGWDDWTSNAFATVTSIIMTARTGTGVGDTCDVGIVNRLGLSNVIYDAADVHKVKKNNADYPHITGYVVDVTYDCVDPTTGGAIVGGDDFTIWYGSNLNLSV